MDAARMSTLADITAGAADREQTPALPDDLDRLRDRRDRESANHGSRIRYLASATFGRSVIVKVVKG